MKVRLFLLFLLFMTFAAQSASAYENENLIRLHIIANSDSDADQQVKLAVRDAIRECVKPVSDGAECADEALAALGASLEDISALALETLAENGFTYGASAQLGCFYFPDREYAGVVVPAGMYRALRVTLGSGGGQNWWCVLYPDLCFVDEVCRESAANGERVSFYSSIGKWIAEWRRD